MRILLNKKPEQVVKRVGGYKAVCGDEVDMKLAEYINKYGTPVPWKRISEGVYMYGTKRVTVKFLRNNLIIKVGGGSMMLEEFIANYEDIEIAKLNNMNPSTTVVSVQNPQLSGLTKQQKVHLARGASPKGVIDNTAMTGVNTNYSATNAGNYRSGSNQP